MRILLNLNTFLIIYFVFKKASKVFNVNDRRKWLKIIQVLFVGSILTNVGLAIWTNFVIIDV